MKFYIASRTKNAPLVCEWYKLIKEKGYKISLDWTKYYLQDALHRPYEKNEKMTQKCAEESIDGVKNCDVFILLTDEAGVDMYAELGMAIAFKVPLIYVIGDYTSKSVFYFHPQVKRRKNIEEVLKELSIL